MTTHISGKQSDIDEIHLGYIAMKLVVQILLATQFKVNTELAGKVLLYGLNGQTIFLILIT